MVGQGVTSGVPWCHLLMCKACRPPSSGGKSYGERGPRKAPWGQAGEAPRKAHRQLPGAPAPEGLGCPRESKRPRDEATWGRAGGHMGPGHGEP